MCFFLLSDTQDVDLDAILGELCALESQYKDVANSSPHHSSNGKRSFWSIKYGCREIQECIFIG